MQGRGMIEASSEKSYRQAEGVSLEAELEYLHAVVDDVQVRR